MWETRNSNIDSSEKTENNRNVIESEEVNHAVRKEADLKRFSDNLRIKTSNPELSGNQKYPEKIQGIVLGWDKILNLKNKNWRDDEEKVQTQRETRYLEWLDRVETLMSNEEKDLVYSTEDLVYIDRLVSNKDKDRIEALMSDEEFLALKLNTVESCSKSQHRNCDTTRSDRVLPSVSQDKDQDLEKHEDQEKQQDQEKHQEQERYVTTNMLSINTEKQIPRVETRWKIQKKQIPRVETRSDKGIETKR